MRRKSRSFIAGTLLLPGVLAACGDELPTLSGGDHFPDGVRPTTLELLLEAEGHIEELGVFTGYFDPHRALFLLSANQFGGALDAHVLMRPTPFPDFLTVGDRVFEEFEYVEGEFFALVDTIATAPDPLSVELWSVTQDWHAPSMTWTAAVDTAGDRTEWETPGGTRGELLGVAAWSDATANPRGDTIGWAITGEQIYDLLEGRSHGMLIRPEQPGTRLQVAYAGLRVSILVRRDPADAAQDTIVTREVGGPARFIFTPDPPVPAASGADGWWAAGITGARTLLRITLPDSVPGCAAPQVCAAVALRDIALTEAALLLDPIPVPSGFSPQAPMRLALRRVFEPELGRLAPVGQVIAERTFPSAAFMQADSSYAFRFTEVMSFLLQRDTATVSLALLARNEGSNFGYARFAGLDPGGREGRQAPRLRIVYTLPGRQALP